MYIHPPQLPRHIVCGSNLSNVWVMELNREGATGQRQRSDEEMENLPIPIRVEQAFLARDLTVRVFEGVCWVPLSQDCLLTSRYIWTDITRYDMQTAVTLWMVQIWSLRSSVFVCVHSASLFTRALVSWLSRWQTFQRHADTSPMHLLFMFRSSIASLKLPHADQALLYLFGSAQHLMVYCWVIVLHTYDRSNTICAWLGSGSKKCNYAVISGWPRSDAAFCQPLIVRPFNAAIIALVRIWFRVRNM